MNRRVYNCLRKVAAATDQGSNVLPGDIMPLGHPDNDKYRNRLWATATDPKYPLIEALYYGMDKYNRNRINTVPLRTVRETQARSDAGLISGGMDDKYFNIVKHLINYGKTKHKNFLNPENPQPMPKYEGPKLTDDEQKKLKEAERLQVNNK